MKKLLFVLTVISSTLLYTGCNNTDDPKTVLVTYCTAIGTNDIKTAKDLSTTETKKWLDKMAEIFEANKQQPNNFDINTFEFGDVNIKGDSAFIRVKEKKTGGINNFKLRKENGEWRVISDFLAMNEEAIDAESSRILDSLKMSPDNMKSLNIDSFIEAQKKGMKSIDSMLKNIEKH